MLRGPPGIGKSALGREIAAQVQTRGWAVCRVEAAQSGRTYAVMCDITERLIVENRSVLDRISAQARAVLAGEGGHGHRRGQGRGCHGGDGRKVRGGAFGSLQWQLAPTMKPNDLLGVAMALPRWSAVMRLHPSTACR